MANEPLPWQLTVGALRKQLEGVNDEVVVALVVPPGGIGHPELQIICNLRCAYPGGPVFRFDVAHPPPRGVQGT
jgi:hypothetical protein